jgi:hypothetical protein
MITAVETKHRFKQDPRWWKVALFDFVDDFRSHPNAAAIAEPFELDDEARDATLAGVIETLCDERSLKVPEWVSNIPACREPFFVSGSEVLKAAAIVQSPVRFRLRKVFVMENFLHRV